MPQTEVYLCVNKSPKNGKTKECTIASFYFHIHQRQLLPSASPLSRRGEGTEVSGKKSPEDELSTGLSAGPVELEPYRLVWVVQEECIWLKALGTLHK